VSLPVSSSSFGGLLLLPLNGKLRLEFWFGDPWTVCLEGGEDKGVDGRSSSAETSSDTSSAPEDVLLS
jgi:hypothetical protein